MTSSSASDVPTIPAPMITTRGDAAMRRSIRREACSEARGRAYTPGDRPMTEPSVPTARTLEDPLAEALRVVAAADAKGLLVRLMGGMAVRAHSPEWTHRTRRLEVDLDFATRAKDRAAFYELLETEGYTPDK